MVDVVDVKTRSQMMAGIRSSNTQPEKIIRTELHHRGMRFARSSLGLVGKPDVVLPHWRVAVFVNGCFWHLHGCRLSKLPSTRAEFWSTKLRANQDRDRRNVLLLLEANWRVLTVWECSMKGVEAMKLFAPSMDAVARWIREQPDSSLCEVSSNGLIFREKIDESD